MSGDWCVWPHWRWPTSRSYVCICSVQWLTPLLLGAHFRRQPLAPSGATLRALGVDRSARPSKGGVCRAINAELRSHEPLLKRRREEMLIAKKLLDTRGPSLAATQIEQFRATGFRGPYGQPAMDKTRELTTGGSLSSVEGQSPLHQCRLALVRPFLKKAREGKEERKKGRKEERKKGRHSVWRTSRLTTKAPYKGCPCSSVGSTHAARPRSAAGLPKIATSSANSSESRCQWMSVSGRMMVRT